MEIRVKDRRSFGRLRETWFENVEADTYIANNFTFLERSWNHIPMLPER